MRIIYLLVAVVLLVGHVLQGILTFLEDSFNILSTGKYEIRVREEEKSTTGFLNILLKENTWPKFNLEYGKIKTETETKAPYFFMHGYTEKTLKINLLTGKIENWHTIHDYEIEDHLKRLGFSVQPSSDEIT